MPHAYAGTCCPRTPRALTEEPATGSGFVT
jgi:hypothetical protein